MTWPANGCGQPLVDFTAGNKGRVHVAGYVPTHAASQGGRQYLVKGIARLARALAYSDLQGSSFTLHSELFTN